jgi:hypothetical protein
MRNILYEPSQKTLLKNIYGSKILNVLFLKYKFTFKD